MAILTAKLSKQVGWILPGYLQFPTLDKVRTATHFQLLQWHRFLPNAKTDDQINVTSVISYRFHNEEASEISESIVTEAVRKWKELC